MQAKPGPVPPLQLPGSKGKWTAWGGGKRRDSIFRSGQQAPTQLSFTEKQYLVHLQTTAGKNSTLFSFFTQNTQGGQELSSTKGWGSYIRGPRCQR